MKPIKIMHVVRSLETGGMENGVRNLLAGLDPDRFEQKVCTLLDGAACLPTGVCLGRKADKPQFLMPALMRTFRRERPDIVHSRNWATIEAVAAAKLSGVRAVVHSEHGRDLQTAGSQPLRRKIMRRFSYAWADCVFCVSDELREYYCRELAWSADRFKVVPNGVDIGKFHSDERARTAMRASIAACAQTLVIGTVGRLDPVKDHVTLIRACDIALRKGVKLKLVIVGEGPERSALEAESARNPTLAERTILAGDVRNVGLWLNGFDVFVLPSLSEGMSNTLLEAMAVGVATIATAVGSNTEIIEEGSSGLLVQPKDAESICACIMRLADEQWRKSLGENAHKRVATYYSLDRMLKRYTDTYCQLLEQETKRIPTLSRA